MQLYATSVLQRKTQKNGDPSNDYYFQVPNRLLTHLNFNKYDFVYLYFIAPKNFNPKEIKTDEIEIRLSSFDPDIIKELIYCELSMSNIPNAFSYFLDVFKLHKINILDCRAIDSVFDNNGKVELVCQIPMFTMKYNDLESEMRKRSESIDPLKLTIKCIEDIENELNEILNRKVPVLHYEKFQIKLDYKSIDRFLIDSIGKKNKNEFWFFNHKIPTIEIFKVEEINELHDGSRTIKDKLEIPIFPKESSDSHDLICDKIKEKLKSIDGKNFHLGISAESKFNMLQAKFKSLNELILPFEVTFSDNSPGELYKFTKSLGDNGLNLRMIEPIRLNETTFKYLIQADISQSKYKFFHSHVAKTILDIIRSDIFKISHSTEISVSFGPGYEKNQNDSQTIIDSLSISVKDLDLAPMGDDKNDPIIYSTIEEVNSDNPIRLFNCIFSAKKKIVRLNFSIKENHYLTEDMFIEKIKEELNDIPLDYEIDGKGKIECENNEQIELLLYYKIVNILIELIAPKFIYEYLSNLLTSCSRCKKTKICNEIRLEKCFTDMLNNEELDKSIIECIRDNGEKKEDVIRKIKEIKEKYEEKYKSLMGKTNEN